MKQETKKCERCRTTFECKGNDIALCQCIQGTIRQETIQFLKTAFRGCLCVDCLKQVDEKMAAIKGEVFPASNELIEDVHFYIENGLFVFTERYHLLRGFCCISGCRHCPYGFKK